MRRDAGTVAKKAGLLTDEFRLSVTELTDVARGLLEKGPASPGSVNKNISAVEREYDRGLITDDERRDELMEIFTAAHLNVLKAADSARRAALE
jgi:hypothetical protein